MGHHNHKQKINHIVDLKTQLTAAKVGFSVGVCEDFPLKPHSYSTTNLFQSFL